MSANDTTVRRPFRECTEVSQLCPVDMTVLAYYPNFGANIFFAVAFGLVVLASATIGTWKRTWTFMLFVTGGSILETVGMQPWAIPSLRGRDKGDPRPCDEPAD